MLMSRRKSTQEFINESREVHGDRYEYLKVEYVGNKTKVCIICPKHGEFWQVPSSHLHGYGCQKCAYEDIGKKIKLTQQEFVDKAVKVHSGKYDYSKVKYNNSHKKVCIICTEHGEFWQMPYAHLNGQGCPICKGGVKMNYDEFFNKANKIHEGKYEYSNVKYINTDTKVCIVCPTHGEFLQRPHDHLKGCGCPKCKIQKNIERLRGNTTNFIENSIKVHNNKYDYSEVGYVNNKTKVCVICPTHGGFWQKPNMHLNGQGCPMCSSSYLEKEINAFLSKNNIIFKDQYRCKWLGLQRLDFYLPDYNVAIECQGRQHFKAVDFFGGDDGFISTKLRDKKKLKKCQDNGVKLLYYSNLGIDYPYHVFEDKELLLEEIKKHGKQTS